MDTSEDDPNYRHPRCYANARGGCSDKISGEHFISHNLIKLYGGERAMVTPSPAYRTGGRAIPGKIFTAHVLCTRHNNGLTSADAAAKRFAEPLRTIAARFAETGDFGENESHSVNGPDFQRWVLKLLMTHAAHAVLSKDGERISSSSRPAAVDLLLDRAAWPRTWGMAVGPAFGNTYLTAHPFHANAINDWWAAEPFVDNDGELCGGIVHLAGVSFALSLFNQGMDVGYTSMPESPFFDTILRPGSMTWDLDGITKTIEFVWDDGLPHRGRVYGLSSSPVRGQVQ